MSIDCIVETADVKYGLLCYLWSPVASVSVDCPQTVQEDDPELLTYPAVARSSGGDAARWTSLPL